MRQGSYDPETAARELRCEAQSKTAPLQVDRPHANAPATFNLQLATREAN
jgi:hypothetical protein